MTIKKIKGSELPEVASPTGIYAIGVKNKRTVRTSLDNLATKDELKQVATNSAVGTLLLGDRENIAAIKLITESKTGHTYKANDTGDYWTYKGENDEPYDSSKWENIGNILPSDALRPSDVTDKIEESDKVVQSKAVYDEFEIHSHGTDLSNYPFFQKDVKKNPNVIRSIIDIKITDGIQHEMYLNAITFSNDENLKVLHIIKAGETKATTIHVDGEDKTPFIKIGEISYFKLSGYDGAVYSGYIGIAVEYAKGLDFYNLNIPISKGIFDKNYKTKLDIYQIENSIPTPTDFLTPIYFNSYEELKAYRDSGKCVKGQSYMFPYICKYYDPQTNEYISINTSENIVVVSNGWWFSHNAGFSNDSLGMQILYDFDNIVSCSWAGSYGVIYRMEDNRGNIADFDFLNIKFKRFKFLVADYDATKAYSIGDFVKFDGKIQMCMNYCKGFAPYQAYFGVYWIPVFAIDQTEYLSHGKDAAIRFMGKDYTLKVGTENISLPPFMQMESSSIQIISSDKKNLPNVVIWGYGNSNSIVEGRNITIARIVNSQIKCSYWSMYGETYNILTRELNASNIDLCDRILSCAKLHSCDLGIINNSLFSSDESEYLLKMSTKASITDSILLKGFLNSNVKGAIENSLCGFSYDSDIFRIKNQLAPTSYFGKTYNGIEDIPQDEKMEWWAKERIGMFIHWGLYAVWAGEFKGVNMKGETVDFNNARDGGGAGSEWMMRNALIPKDTYLSRVNEFTDTNFNPDNLALMAKKAGAGYIVITAKHHEGVCLWGTPNDQYNITLSPFQFNNLNRLKKACTDIGIKFGLYFSQNLDWILEGGFGQSWNTVTKGQHEEYIDNHVIPSLKELFTNLDPDILWWDIPSGNEYQDLANKIADFVKNYAKKELITNDRLSYWHKGDFGTGEDHFYNGSNVYSENCFNINGSWGYDATKDNDEAYRYANAEGVLRKFYIGSVCRGQNTMMNIGPDRTGKVPYRQANIFNEVGNWMDINQRSLKGCTKIANKTHQQWGRLTQNTDTKELFLHVFTRDTSLYLDGVLTNNLIGIYDIHGNLLDFEIISRDRVYIPNFRDIPINTMPYPILAKFSGDIGYLDYVYVDNSLDAAALFNDDMYVRSLQLSDNKQDVVVSAYWEGEMNAYFKFNGETGTYALSMILRGFDPGLPTIEVDITVKGNGIDITSRVTITSNMGYDHELSELVPLVKGKIYNLSINKINTDSWFGLKCFEFKNLAPLEAYKHRIKSKGGDIAEFEEIYDSLDTTTKSAETIMIPSISDEGLLYGMNSKTGDLVNFNYSRNSIASTFDKEMNVVLSENDMPRIDYGNYGANPKILIEKERTNLIVWTDRVYLEHIEIGEIAINFTKPESLGITDSNKSGSAILDKPYTSTFWYKILEPERGSPSMRIVNDRPEGATVTYRPMGLKDRQYHKDVFSFNAIGTSYVGHQLYNIIGEEKFQKKVYLKCNQIEEGEESTSYIPTENAPVTRKADALSINIEKQTTVFVKTTKQVIVIDKSVGVWNIHELLNNEGIELLAIFGRVLTNIEKAEIQNANPISMASTMALTRSLEEVSVEELDKLYGEK